MQGAILELGTGDHSTPVLHSVMEQEDRMLVSAESDQDWLGR